MITVKLATNLVFGVCALSALSVCAAASVPDHTEQSRVHDVGAGVREQAGMRLIEAHVLSCLRPEDRARVLAAVPNAGRAAEGNAASATAEPATDEQYAIVRGIVSRPVFDRMRPEQRQALTGIMLDRADGQASPAFCFSPETEQAVVDAFNRAVYGPFGDRFFQAGRWGATASGAANLRGDRITLTYSFVPDGTTVPTLNRDGSNQVVLSTSNLFARMRALYGNDDSVWQALYQQVLTRWSQLIGVTYVRENNDDGAPINPNGSGTPAPGVLGVRGDCRFSGTALDGNNGVLAFNYFPSAGVGGDMVIDTNDSYFATLSGNSLRLRNILAHEHGHGLGMAHVCPASQTKLMEPFISTAYDGPRFDDIINGQRYYGDVREPNDTFGSATALSAPLTTDSIVGNLSIDGTSDIDYYSISVPGNSLLAVTVRPAGSVYLNGQQNGDGSCPAGTNFDPTTITPLTLQVLGTNGTSVLGSGTAGAAGQSVTLHVPIAAAGNYYMRVNGGTPDNIQAYELVYSAVVTPVLIVTAPSGTPAYLSPAAPTSFPVRIQISNDTLVPGSAQLMYRYSGGAFSSAALVPAGGDVYTAALPPPPCASTPQFYITATGASAGTVTLPVGAPGLGLFSATPGVVAVPFTDDFEIDRGWSYGAPGDTASTGIWVRADPIGTAAQPETAFSPANCAFTGQGTVGGVVGENDVDTGTTTLTSPVLNLAGLSNVTISYARWYSNNAGASPNVRTFRVDISSDNGANWVNAETVGPSGAGTSGGWVQAQFNPAALIPLTATVRVRFVADDTAGAEGGSLVEAAIDNFSVSALTCTDPVVQCPADFNASGAVTVQDIFDFLAAWFAGQISADFNHSGVVTVQDIFDFLAAWFGGC